MTIFDRKAYIYLYYVDRDNEKIVHVPLWAMHWTRSSASLMIRVTAHGTNKSEKMSTLLLLRLYITPFAYLQNLESPLALAFMSCLGSVQNPSQVYPYLCSCISLISHLISHDLMTRIISMFEPCLRIYHILSSPVLPNSRHASDMVDLISRYVQQTNGSSLESSVLGQVVVWPSTRCIRLNDVHISSR